MKKLKKEKDLSINDLAAMVAQSFSDIEERMIKGFNGVEEKLTQRFDQKIDQLSNRIDDLALNRVTWEGLKVVEARVKRIEKRLRISLK